MNDVISWLALPTGAGRVVTGVAADRDHLELVTGWAQTSSEGEAWLECGGPARLAAHVDGPAGGGARSWIVLLGGQPLSYLETSRIGDTPLDPALLAADLEVDGDDMVWGAHLSPSGVATESTRHLVARGLLASAFLVTGVERVFAPLAPGERGRLATGEGAGMTQVAEIEVDGAERLVLRSDRSSFAAAWPGDMASVELSPVRRTRRTRRSRLSR